MRNFWRENGQNRGFLQTFWRTKVTVRVTVRVTVWRTKVTVDFGCRVPFPTKQRQTLRQILSHFCVNNLNAFSAQQNVISKGRFFGIDIFVSEVFQFNIVVLVHLESSVDVWWGSGVTKAIRCCRVGVKGT